ncbi:MAG: hypothetical protein ACPGVU_10250 [Limisphaerales bacterium]
MLEEELIELKGRNLWNCQFDGGTPFERWERVAQTQKRRGWNSHALVNKNEVF